MANLQSNDVITASIGVLYATDKESLLDMLSGAGLPQSEGASEKEVLDAAFKALKDNPKFRSALQGYLNQNASATDFSNYVDSDFFNLTPTFNPKTSQAILQATSKPSVKPTQKGTGFGNALRSIFSQENINTAVGAGVNIAATKLQNNANRAGEQRAISFEVAKAQTAIAEAEAARARDAAKKRNAWVVPVAVIGGLLIVGTIVYFAVRKRKPV